VSGGGTISFSREEREVRNRKRTGVGVGKRGFNGLEGEINFISSSKEKYSPYGMGKKNSKLREIRIPPVCLK